MKLDWNDNASKNISNRILNNLELAGEFVESEWKLRVSGHYGEDLKAVDTGAYLNSVTHEVKESKPSVIIGTPLDYPIYVEFGTSKMQARPSGRQSVLENKEKIKKILAQ